MPGGARRSSGRQRGSPARQRNSSLLVSARQLQALVRQHHDQRPSNDEPPILYKRRPGRALRWLEAKPRPRTELEEDRQLRVRNRSQPEWLTKRGVRDG